MKSEILAVLGNIRNTFKFKQACERSSDSVGDILIIGSPVLIDLCLALYATVTRCKV